jgi:preprotein translocase subunit SecF
VVGTYSSIAIAAPILLTGAGKPREAGAPRGKAVGQLQRA